MKIKTFYMKINSVLGNVNFFKCKRLSLWDEAQVCYKLAMRLSHFEFDKATNKEKIKHIAI